MQASLFKPRRVQWHHGLVHVHLRVLVWFDAPCRRNGWSRRRPHGVVGRHAIHSFQLFANGSSASPDPPSRSQGHAFLLPYW